MRVEGTHKRENANEVGKLGAEQTEEARELKEAKASATVWQFIW